MDTYKTNGAKNTTGQQYIIFLLGETYFGVEIHQMLRIIRLTTITRVPHAPDFLEGIINYHGQAVPVVDLKKRMALSAGEKYSDEARILLVELETQPVGMLVDAVVEISRLPDESIEPPPEMIAQVNGVYLTGVARCENRLTVLLDLSRLLTVEEVAEVEAWRDEQ